ncbi:MAG TPA: DUF502 domain-containing protein [Candidatus Udaeobacter sp.]|jgi:uncharacterized membrane protein|nr:DUF502 domain-containing protein [Candidatus Udaeobacter sp.]
MAPPEPGESRARGAFASRLRDYLLTGLLALGPTAITLWIFLKLLNAVDQLLGQYLKFDALGGQRIPGLGLAATLLLLILVGWIVSLLGGWIGGRSLLSMWEHLLTRIPGVGILYGSTKSIGQAIVRQRHEAFKQVVLVPWPSPGIYRVGFVAARPSPDVSERLGQDLEVVFVPHTPNPASGFVHYVPRTAVVYLDWTVEDALRVIISGGVVQPGGPSIGGGPVITPHAT